MTTVIEFCNVTKEYPLYHHIGSGIKDLFFTLVEHLTYLKGVSIWRLKTYHSV